MNNGQTPKKYGDAPIRRIYVRGAIVDTASYRGLYEPRRCVRGGNGLDTRQGAASTRRCGLKADFAQLVTGEAVG